MAETYGPLDQRKLQLPVQLAAQPHAMAEQTGEMEHATPEQKRKTLELRAAKIMEQPIEFMDHPSFRDAAPAAEILGPVPEAKDRKPMRAPSGLPPYLASLYEVPLLNAAQEVYYFRKMNFLKYRAATLRDKLNAKRPSARIVGEIEQLLHDAAETKNLLIRTNLRLVVAVARRFAPPGGNFFELVSDVNISLMLAVEKFDFGRGFKFSTYATWAIQRNFSRSIPAEYTRSGRFRTGNDEMFQQEKDQRSDGFAEERTNRLQHDALTKILKNLETRDRDIITLRYGLTDTTEPMTLEQIGRRFGVSKERIRQLEAKALRKLREIATREKLDLLGV